MLLTKEILQESDAYVSWIGNDKVVLIHDTYKEDDNYAAFIVVTKHKEQFDVTRFFVLGNVRISTSVDHNRIDLKALLHVLMNDYSTGLK